MMRLTLEYSYEEMIIEILGFRLSAYVDANLIRPDDSFDYNGPHGVATHAQEGNTEIDSIEIGDDVHVWNDEQDQYIVVKIQSLLVGVREAFEEAVKKEVISQADKSNEWTDEDEDDDYVDEDYARAMDHGKD